jgi:hypothetical protein
VGSPIKGEVRSPASRQAGPTNPRRKHGRLYDTPSNWSQARDLSKEHPDKLHEPQRLWLIEAVKYGVLPLDDRVGERLNPNLYAKDGKPKYCYNLLGVQRFYVEGDKAIPAGQHQVRMEFSYDGGGLGEGGNVLLFLDGEKVGEGRVAATAAMVFSADDTCDVGMEGGAFVSEDYGPRGEERLHSPWPGSDVHAGGAGHGWSRVWTSSARTSSKEEPTMLGPSRRVARRTARHTVAPRSPPPRSPPPRSWPRRWPAAAWAGGPPAGSPAATDRTATSWARSPDRVKEPCATPPRTPPGGW